MQNKYKILLVLLMFCCAFQMLHARDYMLKHIETSDGLSNSQVNVVYEDSRGFMWFGTASGLNRYDGYHMDVYRSEVGNVYSLPDSYIRDIQESVDGRLWVLTNGGYALYNPHTNMFERDVRQHVFEFGLEDLPTLVYIDKQKNYWFYVEGKGCYWYSNSQKILYPFLQGEEGYMLPVGKVTDMTECKDGVLLAYESGLIACVSGETRRVVWTNDFIPASAVKAAPYASFVDKNENVWVYGTTGLFVYNKEQGKWIPSLKQLAIQWNQSLSPALEDAIVGVGQDAKGCIWIATRHEGIMVLSPQEKSITWVREQLGESRTLKHNSLRSLYINPSKDIVWIGTARSGLSYYSESAYKFRVDVPYDVTAMAYDGNGNYWLGTSESGVLYYTLSSRKVQSLNALEGKIKDAVYSLLKTRDGHLWIGTDKGSLYCLQGNQVKEYNLMSGDMNPVPTQSAITSLVEDERGDIWIATMGAGVQNLNVKTGRFTIYNKDKNQFPSNKITSLFISKEGDLIMGTPQGVAIMDGMKGHTRVLTGCRNGNRPFTGLYINQVIEDCRGLLWIATREGVNIYDPKNDVLDVINVVDGLPNTVICGLAEADEQNMWITTAGGIAHVMVGRENNGGDYTYRIYGYTESDGLQGYEFNNRSIMASADGYIAVGGLHGLNVFSPNDIVFNKKLPRVLFSGLRLFDQKVIAGKEYGGYVILKSDIGDQRQLILDASHTMFTIQFGADDYSMPEDIRFKYKLEGFSDDWFDCMPSQHELTFTNLHQGKYLLKIKATNSDGYSGDETAQLLIEIRDSFWTSKWAVVIYTLILIIALLVAVSIKKKKNGVVSAESWQHSSDNVVSVVSQGENVASLLPEKKMESDDLDKNGEIRNSTILIMDENPDYLSFLANGLSNSYNIKKAESVEHAWETLLVEKPDLFLCSVSTVDSKGYDLCHWIKNDVQTSSLPIILLTTRQNEDLQELKIEDYLAKPFTMDVLRKRVNQILSCDDSSEQEYAEVNKNAALVDINLNIISSDEQIIYDAMRYVEENISRTDLSVEEMARELGMSRAHLYKKMVASSGKTPIEFIRSIRLRKAYELLKDPRYNVSEVAYQVGFNNPKYFTKYFTDEYGILPSVFKERNQKK